VAGRVAGLAYPGVLGAERYQFVRVRSPVGRGVRWPDDGGDVVPWGGPAHRVQRTQRDVAVPLAAEHPAVPLGTLIEGEARKVGVREPHVRQGRVEAVEADDDVAEGGGAGHEGVRVPVVRPGFPDVLGPGMRGVYQRAVRKRHLPDVLLKARLALAVVLCAGDHIVGRPERVHVHLAHGGVVRIRVVRQSEPLSLPLVIVEGLHARVHVVLFRAQAHGGVRHQPMVEQLGTPEEADVLQVTRIHAVFQRLLGVQAVALAVLHFGGAVGGDAGDDRRQGVGAGGHHE